MKPFSPETMAALKTGLKLSRAQYRLLVHGLIGHAGRYIVEGGGCTERAVFAESKGEELVEYVFGLSKVNNSVDGLSNTIETPHAHIKCFNDAFAAYAADRC